MIKSDRKDYVLLQKVSILNKKCYLLFLIIISIKYTFYTRTESQSMEKIKGTNKKRSKYHYSELFGEALNLLIV